ncbi:hypothetical protein AD998_12650 [bacterium 336/3]|nr:hypothetical protein AD998_12650 [bacterium 336/3]
MQKAFQKIIGIFILLFVFTFPFPYKILPDVGGFVSPFFESIIKWIGDNIFFIQKPYTVFLSSDSTGLYIHTLILFLCSFILGFLWYYRWREHSKSKIFVDFIYLFCRYYLALQMFIYGFNKVFKWQFYLPEPNTLFTRLGDISPDLLYWSTMGLSRPYTIFAGLMEIVPAILLLFRRTQLLGAILLFLVLANVWMINLSFDISVKLYSSFLLLITAYLIAPYLKVLRAFFQGKMVTLGAIEFSWKPFIVDKWNKIFKIIIILFFVVETFWQYIEMGNFNDDKAPRPYLHGAYQVHTFVKNKDTLAVNHTETWKHFFVHRRGYFIVQFDSENMQDYKLEVDSSRKTFKLTREIDKKEMIFQYQIVEDKNIKVSGIIEKDTFLIEAKKLDLSKMPALQKSFHWRVDE